MMLGIIPARSGSKGIPNKNIYPLCGKRLIDYTIDVAVKSKLDDIILTTDIPELLGVFEQRFVTIQRPNELCQDDTEMIYVIQNAIEYYEKAKNINIDSICLLQPTSPLRTIKDIDTNIDFFKQYDISSIYSGYNFKFKKPDKVFDKYNSTSYFQRNGAIFIAKRKLIEQDVLWDYEVKQYEMPVSRSIDIDTMEDMFIAESLIKNGVLEKY